MDINSNSPASHFGAKVENYKSKAVTQLEIAKELAQYISLSGCNLNGIWLDIGSGPAVLDDCFYSQLPQIQPFLLDISKESLIDAHRVNSSICSICSDMDKLPLLPNSIDNIVASSSLQWSANTSQLLQNCKSILKENGVLALAVFTKGTLDNLRKAQEKFKLPKPVHFFSHEEMKNLLIENGFEIVTEMNTTKIEKYRSGVEALKAISTIGASHHSGKKLSPAMLRQFISFLESLSDSQKTHSNIYEVSYFIAKVNK